METDMSQPAVLGMRPAAGQCPSAELEALAVAVGRLSPDCRDPERYHLDRGEIVADLRRLARTLKGTA